MNYKSNINPIKKDEVSKDNKYDVIEIKNKNASDKQSLSVNSIKKNIVSKINEETNTDKINKIKDSINNKTYSIDVDEIVRKLLK